MRRGATALAGILLVDKPAGMTSHDVVSRVRRATGERRVGHAGTLDPAATGLLVVLVGPATRLEPYLSRATKSYDATICFGTATDTDDASGAVIRSAVVPSSLMDRASAERALAGLVGASRQVPPQYSAIKQGGVVAYRAARVGSALQLAERDIVVFQAVLDSLDPRALSWNVSLTVSKGTYIRAIARDLGTRLGTVAHLGSLRRTASGPLCVEAAVTLDALPESPDEARVRALFADPIHALGCDVVDVSGDMYERVRNGVRLPGELASACPVGSHVAVTMNARLMGIYLVERESLVPRVVFPEGLATTAS